MNEDIKIHLPKIAEKIRQGKCIFFLGAYASIDVNGNQPPSPAKLSKLLNADLKLENEKDLAKISLFYELNFGRGELYNFLHKQIHCQEYRPALIQRFIAKIAKKGLENGIKKLPMIMTTNYDVLMEAALAQENVDYEVYCQSLNEKTKHYKFLKNENALVVYKFHGCITEPRSIVITEEDYINNLINQFSEEKRSPKYFDRLFIDNEFLFLGYSLSDWTFRILYNGIFANIDPMVKPSSYGIQKNPRHEIIRFWNNPDRNRSVIILDIDQYEFIESLASELQIKI